MAVMARAGVDANSAAIKIKFRIAKSPTKLLHMLIQGQHLLILNQLI